MSNQDIKIIVFDFDGVIVRGSEDIKDEAWYYVLEESNIAPGDIIVPAFLRAKKKYSKAKGSRFDILKDVFSSIGVAASEIPFLVQEYAKKFDDMVQKGITELGVFEEDREALGKLSRKFSLYVNSATPEDPLQDSVKRLGLNHFFAGVFAQPRTKVENLKKIAQHASCESSVIVFIGDGEGDVEAAKVFCCRFVGIVNSGNGWTQENFPIIHSVSELPDFINQSGWIGKK